MTTISLKQARRIALKHQLLSSVPKANTKKNLQSIIETLGYIQIDTISIVERAHHHILWTRMPGYERTMLDELQEKDKTIFEYWSHAAAYLPMRDYRYTHYRREKYSDTYCDWASKHKKLVNGVLDRIRAEGPLQSRDFQHVSGKNRSGWWEWKPAKDALEHLFHSGELMIVSRRGFQKVYDITARVLPAGVDTSTPTSEEYHAHLIQAAVRAHGLVSEVEITYLKNFDSKVLKKIINERVESGDLCRVTVKKSDAGMYLSTNKIIEQTLKPRAPRVHILSPFDNLIIQRKRAKALFSFDFFIEFYLPAGKRKFGYFCMPVLLGETFIGKVDAKADRKNDVFEVINFFFEKGVKVKTPEIEIVRNTITDLGLFAGCQKVNWNGTL